MALSHELHETNEMLRVGLSQLGQLTDSIREALEPKPLGRRSEAVTVGGLLFIPTFSALRNLLVEVPERFWRRDYEDRTATIECPCGFGHKLREHTFQECACGRLFCVTRRSVKVIPLDR